MFDLFICHASEDKESTVRPLAQHLAATGLRVWYDEFSLKLGDSLRQSIDRGLSDSRYGVVVLSPSFFKKNWPQAELDGLFAKEIGGEKTILPVWHQIEREDVLKQSPLLADRVAAKTSEGLDKVVEKILAVVEPTASHLTKDGLTISITPTTVRLYADDWSVRTPVTITNRSDSPLYYVGVKIAIQTSGVTSESVQVEPGSSTTSLNAKAGPIRMTPDFGINCIDSEGREVVGLFFHTIGAKQSKEFVVSGTTRVASTAQIKLWSFKKEPPVMVQQPTRAAMPLEVPESVRLKGLRVGLFRH